MLVHHRGPDVVGGDELRVALLRWVDPRPSGRARWDDVTTWPFADPVPGDREVDGFVTAVDDAGVELIGLNFAAALRSFLRQDPNIILVGEIRDFETAEIAVKAALTGHLVLSTLHTNDAPSAATRLVEMGIEPFLLASTLRAVIALLWSPERSDAKATKEEPAATPPNQK